MSRSDVDQAIHAALETLDLPTLITRADVKKRYRQLARQYHPDRKGIEADMEKINAAYEVLIAYIDDFRYRFDADEIAQQYPEGSHAQKFRF